MPIAYTVWNLTCSNTQPQEIPKSSFTSLALILIDKQKLYTCTYQFATSSLVLPSSCSALPLSLLSSYIERMRSNARYMTLLQPQKSTPTPTLEQQASRWVDPSAVPEGMTMSQALMKLHDHMISDSMKLSQWLENND